MKTILIGTPHGRDFTPEYVRSLARSLIELHRKDYLLDFIDKESCYVHSNRNCLFKKAYDLNPDYFLFIDTDSEWRPSDIRRLVELDKDIAAGLYAKRTTPIQNVAYRFEDKGERGAGLYPVVDVPDEPFRVDAAGTGFMLIRGNVLRGIVERTIKEFDTFFFPYDPVHVQTLSSSYDFLLKLPSWNSVFAGDDISFCSRVKEMGYEIWVHPKVLIGHIGAVRILPTLSKKLPEFMSQEVVDKLVKWDWDAGKREGSLFENGIEGMQEQLNFLRNLLLKIKPKYILETGTYKGQFCYFALCALGPDLKRIYTFDVNETCGKVVAYLNGLFGDRIRFFLGDSKRQLTDLAGTFSIVAPSDATFVWIDGGHDYKTCLSDLENCAILRIKHICVDDYRLYASVAAAVNDFCDTHSYRIEAEDDFSLDNRGIVYLTPKG